MHEPVIFCKFPENHVYVEIVLSVHLLRNFWFLHHFSTTDIIIPDFFGAQRSVPLESVARAVFKEIPYDSVGLFFTEIIWIENPIFFTNNFYWYGKSKEKEN